MTEIWESIELKLTEIAPEWENENQMKSILDFFPEIGTNELVFDRNKTDIKTIGIILQSTL